MRIYTVHCPRGGAGPGADPVLVKEGFSWPAFLLTAIWLLWKRLWLAAGLVIAANLVLALVLEVLGADALVSATANLALALIVGFSANDWLRTQLARDGLRMTDVVAGGDADAALQRWLDAEQVRLV